MSKFSEESLLLIRNWDAYRDIVEAGNNLKPELRALIPDIKKRLQGQKWWNNKWVMADQQENPDAIQICFWDSRDTDDGRMIWVGVENLTPDAVFGNSLPTMFVWICDKLPDLKAELKRIIRAGGNPIVGEWDASQNSQYIIRKSMSTCLPEEIDRLEDMIFDQLAEFCGYYAQFSDQFNKAVQKQLKTNK